MTGLQETLPAGKVLANDEMDTLDATEPVSNQCDFEFVNVCYAVQGRRILDNLTFSSDSTRIGVLGRNGSGKSTLARVLSGLLSPTSGSVCVNGKNPAKDRRAAVREIGILFQNPDHQIIFPTVIEEIAFGITQQGVSRPESIERARTVLDRFSVAHWEDAYVSHLSQGQKHLVCIMAIIAMTPRLLVLDEPFAGLDIPTRSQLRRYLDHYHGTLIHITHLPEDIAGYQQAVWLDSGRIRESGPAGDIIPGYVSTMKQLGEENDIADLPG